jgi:hypothetical protein
MKYDKYIDKEVIPLCNVLNKLPGIQTSFSCCGHGKDHLYVCFFADNMMDLCPILENLYNGKTEAIWNCEVMHWPWLANKHMMFRLKNGYMGKEAYKQSNKLAELLSKYTITKNLKPLRLYEKLLKRNKHKS